MDKTFFSINVNDEIFYLKIENSKILVGPNGAVIKAKVQNIVRTCDAIRASLCLIKEIGGQLLTTTVNLDSDTHIKYNTKDEVNLDAEIIGTTKKAVLDKALMSINNRISNIEDLQNKCESIAEELLIAGAEVEIELKEADELTLEEAASMAL